jgi:hypothetical protein
MQEILFGNSLYFLTSILQTFAMQLTKGSLLIIPIFLEERKNGSEQLVLQNDNNRIAGVDIR